LMEKAGNDTHLFHEYLETHNDPFYLHEFVARAESHGLQYLSKETLKGMLPQLLSPEIRALLEPLPLVEQQQYLDFIHGTRFHRTLLCRKEVALNRTMSGEKITGFHIALTNDLEKVAVNIHNDEEVEFKNGGGSLTTGNRLSKAAMIYLKEIFPAYVHFDKLYETVINRLGISPRQAQADADLGSEALAANVMLCVLAGMFKPCLNPPRYVGDLSTRPNVGLLARLQAARGNSVTSRLHRPVKMSDVMRHVVRRLDGSHDRKDLIESMRKALDSGEIVVTSNGKKVQTTATAHIPAAVDKTLQDVVTMGLLSE
jgi:methyltransferase-like protein